MQISSIGANMAFGKVSNSKRIHELEQKRAEIQWASEGCTGELNPEDEYELTARRQLAQLREKQAMLSWSSEGCNCSLCHEDMVQLTKLENIISAIDAKIEKPNKVTVVEKNIYDMPNRSLYEISDKNPYGVPDSTFWGDWAR